MYLISVYFDDDTNRILKRHIEKIALVTGNTFMTDNHVPPHLTISAIEAKKPEVLLPAFSDLKGRIGAGDIAVASVGQLMPYVMFGAPVLNRYLQELSQTVYEKMKDIPETKISRYYRPFSWMPHITLGKTLDKEQMQRAFAAMQESFIPIHGRVTEIGLARVNPHEDLMKWEMYT